MEQNSDDIKVTVESVVDGEPHHITAQGRGVLCAVFSDGESGDKIAIQGQFTAHELAATINALLHVGSSVCGADVLRHALDEVAIDGDFIDQVEKAGQPEH